ncbi:hypothetical protein ACIBCO_36010 [Streptomyces violascens]|uniref:hypothetical protein n=1 Tax=Streptomyces violascens TaxID=67381 RepID=UPI0037A0CCD9
MAGEANIHGSAGQRGAYLLPYGFYCTACDLDVDSNLLSHLGDLDEVVLLNDDPYDYLADEPPVDEDFYRGR